MPLMKRAVAELVGTFWLVLGGCGSAVLAAAFPGLGIGFAGVALAFGLTVVTMAYALGPISGGHFNPAVSVGLAVARRFPPASCRRTSIAQLIGGILAAAVLYVIASGSPAFDVSAGFASNGYGDHSPGGYSLAAGLVCEVVMTCGFLVVILGATDSACPCGAGAAGHRPGPHPHPPGQHPGHQHLREPGPLDRRGALRGRLGAGTAVGLLGGAHRGRGHRRRALPVAGDRPRGGAGGLRWRGRDAG